MAMTCAYMASEQRITLDCPAAIVSAVMDWEPMLMTGLKWFAIGVIVLVLLFGSAFTVRQQTRAIIERFGRYTRTAAPGLNFKIPLIERIAARQPLQIEQLALIVETKTKDNVFVKVHVAVQNRVIAERAADSFYQLDDDEAQISSYVFDVVRAQVPLMDLDHTFEKKDDIARAITETLKEEMERYGFEIVSALVTDIDPDPSVKAAMNEIQAQQRLQVAASAKGEAQKIITVKNAEAESESKRLQGEGIAKQRSAIAAGLRDAVKMVAEASGVDAKEVLQTVMLTQYFDTIKEIGTSENAKVIMIPHSPGGLADIADQIRNGMMVAEQAA